MRAGIIIFSIIFAFLIFWSYAYSDVTKTNIEQIHAVDYPTSKTPYYQIIDLEYSVHNY